MTTPNDMPQVPRRIPNSMLAVGVQIWNEADDGRLKRGEVLRDRLDSLGCSNLHFKTKEGRDICYDRYGFSYVTL